MIGSIQKEKYIVAADCINLGKTMDCQLSEMCERNQENIFCMMITKRHSKEKLIRKNKATQKLVSLFT